MSLSAQTDRDMFDAYLREDMSVWQAYVDTLHLTPYTLHNNSLLYEYGFCGYMVDRDKAHAKPYVQRFREHVEAQKSKLPVGHYEMYMSAALSLQRRAYEPRWHQLTLD